MNTHKVKTRTKALAALAHPLRILVVDSLRDGDLRVNEITAMGSINQFNVSRYLLTLKKAGLVSAQRVKNRMRYRLEAPVALDPFDSVAEVARTDIERYAEKVKKR